MTGADDISWVTVVWNTVLTLGGGSGFGAIIYQAGKFAQRVETLEDAMKKTTTIEACEANHAGVQAVTREQAASLAAAFSLINSSIARLEASLNGGLDSVREDIRGLSARIDRLNDK